LGVTQKRAALRATICPGSLIGPEPVSEPSNLTVPHIIRSCPLVDDQFSVTCPYCGEEVEIYVEPDVRGSFVQDCEVCCNPWRVRVSTEDDERFVSVTRADGSE
jgi:hypothetical protein